MKIVRENINEGIKHLKPKSEEEIEAYNKNFLGDKYEIFLENKKLIDDAYNYIKSLTTFTIVNNIELDVNENDTEYGFSIRDEIPINDLTSVDASHNFYYFFWSYEYEEYILCFQDNGACISIKNLSEFKRHINDKFPRTKI